MRPGAHYLKGATDCHVHACPHVNARSITVFDAVREAAGAGMRAIGLMDINVNSAGYAALAMAELGQLGVEVFGGAILEPSAGGVTVEAVGNALAYGYGPGTGPRFVALPTHHTRFVAEREGRSPAYLETTFWVPESGPVPDPVPEIMDLAAAADAVFDFSGVSGREAVALAEEGNRRGLTRLRAHASHYTPQEIQAIVATGAYVEFSFFYLTHATQIGLGSGGEQKRFYVATTLGEMAERIRAASPERSIVSSDCGAAVLPPPVEGFREFMLLLEGAGFSEAEIRTMAATNPAALFRVGGPPSADDADT